MRLRKRLPADMPAVQCLLAQAGLPADGMEGTEGWVILAGDTPVGHVAIEATPEAVVLRSLVVDPARRGHGLGERLMAAAEAAAGGRAHVLRTDTVGPWMLRRGYRIASLGDVPASVRSTTQFAGTLCVSTPVYLRLPLQAAPAPDHPGDGSHSEENTMTRNTLKAAVRERYAGFVTQNRSCCAPGTSCGCSGAGDDPSLRIGYALKDVTSVPEGANLGLGCGNPVALASLAAGEAVLDLGSGAGFDAFLAAQRVGQEGRVIGVDMTPAMLERARTLAVRHGYTNVEFREGDIEALPVEDATVDAVISNCVINLTTDKAQAFREAFRALKPGGRLMVSDLVLLRPLPEAVRGDMDAYAACIAGALPKEDYLAAIRAAGFQDVAVVGEAAYDLDEPGLSPSAEGSAPDADWRTASACVASVQIQATRPRTALRAGSPCGQGR